MVAYYSGWARKLHDSADARVTFILADGTVVGDSDHEAAEMDNHLAREEIMKAGQEGSARISVIARRWGKICSMSPCPCIRTILTGIYVWR